MQLRKNPPFTINPTAPFEDDKLEHKPSIELLTKLIQSTDQPFVITVEAPWGWGKTKFIERWKAHLATQNHECLYFNAWENDFVSDPLVAFIGELRPIIENTEGGTNEASPIRRGFARLQKLGVALAKKSTPVLIKAIATKALGAEAVKDVAGVVADSADNVADFLSETVKGQIENYDEEKKGILYFRETLKELAEKVTTGEGKPKQLVFFVDELDRCRPDFAITLLERIKHLFNVERIVFVLALDREQLRNTVRCLYGSGDHADTYLRRFIDFSFQLPKPSAIAFAELLQTRFKMLEFFTGRANSQIEYERFLPAFISTSKWLNLDLRTQEQCFTRLNAIFRLFNKSDYIPTDAFCVLVGLRVGNPDLFESLRSGKTPISAHIPKAGIEYNDKEFSFLVEATLMTFFLPVESVSKELRSLGEHYKIQIESKVEADQSVAELMRRKISLLEHIRLNRQNLIRYIEFSSRIN